jgi:integrase
MVFKQKSSKYWWFKFVWNGALVRESAKTTNKRIAEQIERAHHDSLAKGEAGIHDKKPVPTLRQFSCDFEKAIETQCSEKPRTIEFYKLRMRQLLGSELGDRVLDTIDEEAVEKYRQKRAVTKSRLGRMLAPGSVNRELATLRRLLRLAYEWKVINRVPRVKMLRGEKNRESILPHDREAVYLAALPHPLSDVATVLLDTGLRLGEALSLDWAQVRLDPAQGARFGFLTVLSGKAKNNKSRNVPLSARVVGVLKRWEPSRGGLIFRRADGKALQASLMGAQQGRVRVLLKLPADFVLHSLRHTFGTRLGEAGADAFTIMRLMGHSNVTVSQRYVHPSPEAVELAFERLTVLNMQKVVLESGIPKKPESLELQ